MDWLGVADCDGVVVKLGVEDCDDVTDWDPEDDLVPLIV